MSGATWITGDTLTVLRQMPTASVDLVLTSPPFLALRSYLPDEIEGPDGTMIANPDKALEIGSEDTPGDFLDVLLDITEDARRVLAPHGSLCVELGDTYAGSGGAGGDYAENGLMEGQLRWASPSSRANDATTAAPLTGRGSGAAKSAPTGLQPSGKPRTADESRRGVDAKNRGNTSSGTESGGAWPESKSLCLIPELYRFALAYGLNPLTGRTTPRWRVRNVVRWVRPNPPVGALGDKFRPGTSDMVVACGTDEAGRRRYFDLDAVRTPTSEPVKTVRVGEASASKGITGGDNGNPEKERPSHNPAGAPPLDWWKISPSGFKGSHFATFPPELCVRPILAMCPQRVCTTCGEPSRRIVEVEGHGEWRRPELEHTGSNHGGPGTHGDRTRQATTLGWSDCGHDTWRPGVVLDPFGGSGTTLAVATGHGRDAIGIDLDARNADLARERIGPMFFHETTAEQAWPQDGAA